MTNLYMLGLAEVHHQVDGLDPLRWASLRWEMGKATIYFRAVASGQ
jgi:hypothetical protein